MRQEAVVRIADGESEPGIIGRGVRQGCLISPLLFSIYAEVMMIEAFGDSANLDEEDIAIEDFEDGIVVGGKIVRDVRFADDQGMVSGTERGLQKLMNKLNDTAKKFNMKINVQKTKTMVVSRNEGRTVKIKIDDQEIEQVSNFKYLGSLISEDGRCLIDVKTRIALAKDAFNKRKEFLTGGLSGTLKKRMVKVLVWPVAIYGCETWTLKKEEKDKLEALEMWLWRKLEKVNWSDRISNEEVLTMVNESRCLIETIRQRKKNWVGHVLRGNGLLRDVLEGRMLGKAQVGRRREKMLDDLMIVPIEGSKKKEKVLSYRKLKIKAEDRSGWRSWVPETCQEAD